MGGNFCEEPAWETQGCVGEYCHGYYFGGDGILIDGGVIDGNDSHGMQLYGGKERLFGMCWCKITSR